MSTKQHNLLHLSVFLLILICSVVVCRADDRAMDRASLRGIKSVVVKVHTFEREWASELAKAELTEAVLQATNERQLEKSGIAVIPKEEENRSLGYPQCEGKIFEPRDFQKDFFNHGKEGNRKARS